VYYNNNKNINSVNNNSNSYSDVVDSFCMFSNVTTVC